MINYLIGKGYFCALKKLNFKERLIIRDDSNLTYLRTECYDLWGSISDHLDTILMVRHGAGQICNLKINKSNSKLKVKI